jgi:transposase
MANKTKTMLQIRKIIQLIEDGCSYREMNRLTGIHRQTIVEYCQRIKQTGKNYQELLQLPDEELSGLVSPPKVEVIADTRYQWLEDRMEYYLHELERKGVTRQLLWEEYLMEQPDGYCYSHFCEHVARYKRIHQATLHLTHQPGERLEVDFTGDHLHYFDPSTGEKILCPVLVCTLPYSGYSYLEPLQSAKLEHLIPALNRAVTYIGGVPRMVVSDNMSQIVTRSCRYEPSFTELAEQWAVYYQTFFKSTRVGKPKDKPSVEKGVHLSYQRVYARLRNETYYSLVDLRNRSWELQDEFNDRLMYKLTFSRRERFNQEEKAFLKALPQEPFIIKHKADAKVKKNYHVILGEDWHQYSVPYQYIGQQVSIVYDEQVVEVFIKLQRIAVHGRDYRRNGYTTLAEHMPESHRHYLEQRGWTSDDFTERASRIGEYTEKAIQCLLSSRTFIEQTYDGCLGVLHLSDKYGTDRLEAACKRATQGTRITYRIVKNILENNLDKEPLITSEFRLFIPDHDNIRGPQAYS